MSSEKIVNVIAGVANMAFPAIWYERTDLYRGIYEKDLRSYRVTNRI